MTMHVLDSLVVVAPTAWGTTFTAGNALLEPIADPRECGLYTAPVGVSGPARLQDVVAVGNYSVIGLPRRPRSEG